MDPALEIGPLEIRAVIWLPGHACSIALLSQPLHTPAHTVVAFFRTRTEMVKTPQRAFPGLAQRDRVPFPDARPRPLPTTHKPGPAPKPAPLILGQLITIGLKDPRVFTILGGPCVNFAFFC